MVKYLWHKYFCRGISEEQGKTPLGLSIMVCRKCNYEQTEEIPYYWTR